jgi:FkbM family methyltransferase
MSYSQLNQDLTVVSFFSNKREMFFIDIGANDGKRLSNTFLLETKYNWKGICSEPLPKAFKQLNKCRSVHCDNHAVFSKTGLSLEFSESNLLSGITQYIDRHKEVKNCNQIIVKTITLQDLLEKYKAPNIINYFSLDTEGTELEILKSVDFSKYIFLYINLEHNYIEPKRTEMRTLLLNNGYLYKGENHFDDDYIHETTVIGTYYYLHDYTKPILIKRLNKIDFSVSSPYWNDDIGKFNKGSLNWKRLGTGKIFYTHIDYGSGNIWHRDKRKNLLFIGANNMGEISNYTHLYKNGIFIEALPNVYQQLKDNLKKANQKYNTNYIAINKLVTSKINEKHNFNVFSNNGASSSIYEPNKEEWQWNHVKKIQNITLISTTIEHLIKQSNWNNKKYDVVLDVQGAELVVLNGFGKDNIKNICKIKVEISTKEFYKGGVLFTDLNNFLVKNGFEIVSPPESNHCDVTYIRK